MPGYCGVTLAVYNMFKKKEEKNEYFFGKNNIIKVVSEKQILPGNEQESQLCNSNIYIKCHTFGEYMPIEDFIYNYLVVNIYELKREESRNEMLEFLIKEEIPDWAIKLITKKCNELQEEENKIISKVVDWSRNIKK